MYQWWRFVHVAAVIAFLTAHGVSMSVLFRLRRERDPQRVVGLLELSASSVTPFYVALGAVVASGTVAGFLRDWWSQGWIWAAIVVLLLTSVAMLALARPYYRRVGLIARAMASGSEAVTPDQFDSILRARQPVWVAGIGFIGVLVILYMMMFKPTLGLSPPPPPAAVGEVRISAKDIRFDTDTLRGPAGRPFEVVFDNQEAVVHNVSIYTDPTMTDLKFEGEEIVGPGTITYEVPALSAGEYYFVCRFHVPQMNGTLIAG
jgi:plastocyanin